MRRKLVLRAGVSLLVGFVVLELVLRFLLFGPGDLGERLRKARYYANYGTDTFWAHEGVFGTDQDEAKYPDDELGWVSKLVAPGTYLHADEERLRGRRPVLLYGDSFSACMTPAEDCFQGLLRHSEVGTELFLLNFAVSGHGVGQMLLMMRKTLARFADQDPIVVVGIYLDDDLQRTGLSLRQFPKPRFRLNEGELVHDPPLPGGRQAWFDAHGLGVTCYSLSFLVHSGVLPSSLEARASGRFRLRQETKALNHAVLAAIARELETHGVEGFVLLMPGLPVLDGDYGMDWQEPFLRGALQELGLPYVEARREIEADAALHGGYRRLFISEGMARNHYDARGNEVVFGALLRGVRGEFDG